MPMTVVSHPVVADCLARLRDRRTCAHGFRTYLRRATLGLAYEATRDLRVKRVRIATPLAAASGGVIDGPRIVFVPILRAGMGMLEGALTLFPSAVVGVVGLKRDEHTFLPREYYRSLPRRLAGKTVIILDPMLATGGSLAAAAALLKERGADDIRALTLVAAPEGAARMERAHPDVRIYTAGVDAKLNARAYILPGIGDAGDRVFGTDRKS